MKSRVAGSRMYSERNDMAELELPRKIRTFLSPGSGTWYFHIQADNNEVITASEGYQNKQDMLDTLTKYFPEWEIVEEPFVAKSYRKRSRFWKRG